MVLVWILGVGYRAVNTGSASSGNSWWCLGNNGGEFQDFQGFGAKARGLAPMGLSKKVLKERRRRKNRGQGPGARPEQLLGGERGKRGRLVY